MCAQNSLRVVSSACIFVPALICALFVQSSITSRTTHAIDAKDDSTTLDMKIISKGADIGLSQKFGRRFWFGTAQLTHSKEQLEHVSYIIESPDGFFVCLTGEPTALQRLKSEDLQPYVRALWIGINDKNSVQSDPVVDPAWGNQNASDFGDLLIRKETERREQERREDGEAATYK